MLRKVATLEVLESWRAEPGRAGLSKAAHRVGFEYEPRPGYLYVRSRMISSRTNDNHDTFPAAEIAKGYQSFLGKPVFVNHHNANHRRARGVIVAVALHRDRNPDNSPDTWVEGLMEVDALRFPRLAQAIIAGKVNRTSMGVDVEWSKCSACGNIATSPVEYCRHLPALKGKLIRKRNPETGQVEQRLIHEVCAGLSFFENSLLVEDPADPTAYVLGQVDTRGMTASASLSREAMPGGIRFSFTHADDSLEGTHEIRAHAWSGKTDRSRETPAGVMRWHPATGEVVSVGTHKQFRGQGVATAMWQRAHEESAQRGLTAPAHSETQTPAGKGWAPHADEHTPLAGPGQIEMFPRPAGNETTSTSPPPPSEHDPHEHMIKDHGFGDSASIIHGMDEGDLGRWHDKQHEIGMAKNHRHGARRIAAGDGEPNFRDHIENQCIGCGTPVHWSKSPTQGGWKHHRPFGFDHAPMPSNPDDKRPAQDHTFGGTDCLMCHDPVRINLAKMDTSTGGWHHHDGMKRDHPAIPSDAHAVYNDIPRQKSQRDQAHAHVQDVLERQGIPRRQDPSMPQDPFTASWKDPSVPKRPIAYEPELEPRDGSFRRQAGPKATPGDHSFFRNVPMHADHIVNAYHQTSDDEKSLGARWYSDAHHVAGAIAGGNHALGAGLLSAYSPQTAWPINMFNASRAAKGDPPGPGSGAMGMHQKPAMQMLAGQHHSEVLKGPKTRAFAKLIEHGDDTPEDKASGNHQVVVDRHALSVAAGRRLSKEEGGKFPSDHQGHYEHVAHMYRDAASALSQHYGREIKPHEVQAATWLRQQRMNQEEDAAGKGGGGGGASKGRVKTFTNGQERWQQHHQEHHPGGIDQENMHYHGQRRTAEAETRVPPQVDTMRMEECPVCGENDVWSGDRCPVCGFTVPPSMFRDPDTDKASGVRDQLDQTGQVETGPIGSGQDADGQLTHPDQLAPDGTPGGPIPGQQAPMAQQPGQDEQAAGQMEDQQGQEDQLAGQDEQDEGQQIANQGEEDQLSPGGLGCPSCGTSFDPDMAAQPGVPCPACGQGALQPSGGPQKEQEDPSDSEDEDEGDDMPGSKTAAAARQLQARRIAELTARNEVLTAQLRYLASAAGADRELAQIEAQVLRRHADMLNPASPVPDPPEAPAPETTEQALQPAAQDDPSRPGTTPGSLTHVPAEQTTTSMTPGVEIPTPPATNLIDVTAPIQGTNPSQDGGVPLSQRRIETDVRVNPDPLQAHGPGIGGQGDNGTAFPWLLPDGQQAGQRRAASLQPGGSAGEDEAARTYGSLRLARLRIQAGLAQGDDIAVAEQIRSDGALPTPMIAHEIDVLSRTAAARPQPQPRTAPMARQGARSAPSLASVGASATYAPAAYSDDLDATDVFL
jgi:GNAT superfamily N-acetyltransferase